jgi:membrane protease YdiL (CAAX protease family)
VAITAGVCEEVLYRGVVLVVAMLLAPGLPHWALALGVAAVFGLAHIYQGAAGVVVTTMMGAVLGLLVLATGSLLPAVLHGAADLRALLLVPRTVAPVDR